MGTPLSPLQGWWRSLVSPNSRRAGGPGTERDGAGGVAPVSGGTILGSGGTPRVFRAGLDQHQPRACTTPKYSTKEFFACSAPLGCGVWGRIGASRVWLLAQRRWSCSHSCSSQAFDFSSMCFSLNVKWKGISASVFMVALAVMETHQAGAAKYQLCNCRLPLDGKHVFQKDFG